MSPGSADLQVGQPELSCPDRRGRQADPRRAVALARYAGPIVAWLVLVAVAAVTLVQTGTGPSDVLRYLLVWVGFVVVPGMLLWRAAAGRSTTEIELGGGSALGLALLLVCWLVATALGHPVWAAIVPIAVLVIFTTHPRLRPCWRPRSSYTDASRIAWWGSMALLGVVMIHKVSLGILRPTTLPPGPTRISSDAWYALGIARQLTQGFPVADPSFAGGEIRYHWFGIGLITATSQIAGADLVATNFHLWFVPFVVVWMLVIAALIRALLRPHEAARPAARWWCWGPVGACLVVLLPVGLVLTRTSVPGLGTGLNSSSASGAFGSLFVSALGLVLILLLRGAGRPGLWAVAVLLTIASSGIKPTVLPVVAAGSLLVGGWKLLRRSRGWPIAVAAGVGALTVFSIASRIVIGSATGSAIQPFAIVVDDLGYRSLYKSGGVSLPGAGGAVLPAIADGRAGAVSFAVAVLVLFLAAQALPLLALGRVPFSVWRHDPAAVWVAGAVLSGYAATFAIKHSGFSQQWFALNVTGLGIALAVAVVATEVRIPTRPASGRGVVVALTVSAGLGVIVAACWRASTGSAASDPPLTPAIRLFAFATLTVALMGILILLRIWRTRGGPNIAASTVVAALLVGASLPATSGWLWSDTVEPITENPAATVSVPQQKAALWLGAHTTPVDVVISNVFCRPVHYSAKCDHSTLWVSALTGRRLVLDGWAYIPQTMVAYDGSRPGPRMASPFPDRLADSLAVVRRGNLAAACRLNHRYGADWIYADADATTISKRLERFADRRYQAGSVSVFQIDPTRLTCSGS